MNHYAVEIKKIAYVTIQVDARDPTEAEELAWREIESGDYDDHGHWEISDISEEVATDDTRSHGPQGETA
jgi:hypothetical protein